MFSARQRDLQDQPPTLTPKKANDPLAQAEAALKKLRANPSDKQAADALERALQRLKEREKRQGIHNHPPWGARKFPRPTGVRYVAQF
jgi:hypothetical protein